MKTQGEYATKQKPAEEKDTKKERGQRKMNRGRDIKTENTLSVLQDEDTEPFIGRRGTRYD